MSLKTWLKGLFVAQAVMLTGKRSLKWQKIKEITKEKEKKRQENQKNEVIKRKGKNKNKKRKRKYEGKSASCSWKKSPRGPGVLRCFIYTLLYAHEGSP